MAEVRGFLAASVVSSYSGGQQDGAMHCKHAMIIKKYIDKYPSQMLIKVRSD